MSTTIFVPPHVDVSSIQSCLQDVHATFVDMDTETFDAKAKLEKLFYFIVLDKDYFVVYQKQHPEGVECDYRSRNCVMARMKLYPFFKINYATGSLLYTPGEMWAYKTPPVLYFAFRPNADALRANNATEYNTIAEFYDKVEDEDFERFAEIAKTKDSCVSHFFVVCRENDYFVVDTDNPSVSYKFSASVKYRVINDLARKAATIQDFIELDKQLHKRAPGFQLRDNKGVAMIEGEPFNLEIYKVDYEETFLQNEEAEIDYVDVFDDPPDGIVLCGAIEYKCNCFFKVVDGITYLTCDGRFVGVGPNERYPRLGTTADIPPKERRIKIHYAEDGNIMLSKWNGDMYAHCLWYKASYGSIELLKDEPGQPMKLVIRRA
ncbi:hypothetical protein LPJ56_002708 [Coemansia sp. RSA 2599]|nr:hypothetical protein LPJ75_002420 [Coemansia sp. RSA 2598]KAJ1825374.1 hypothetical protein LPJ56_002708 [Coemansia sp. RSA 2599]